MRRKSNFQACLPASASNVPAPLFLEWRTALQHRGKAKHGGTGEAEEVEWGAWCGKKEEEEEEERAADKDSGRKRETEQEMVEGVKRHRCGVSAPCCYNMTLTGLCNQTGLAFGSQQTPAALSVI